MYLGAIEVRLRTTASGSALAIAITPCSTPTSAMYRNPAEDTAHPIPSRAVNSFPYAVEKIRRVDLSETIRERPLYGLESVANALEEFRKCRFRYHMAGRRVDTR